MDRVGTKDHVERETDEAERLVRPAPKVKPPRHDKRRERMDVDDDPDLDLTDKDLSKNYKTIGGSVTHRVLERWAKGENPEAEKVRVRKKETGWVGWVGQDALKSSPGDYEVVEAEEDEGKEPDSAETAAPGAQKGETPPPTAEADAKAQTSLQDMAKADAEFAAILKDFTNPKSDMFTWAKSAPDTPAAKFLRGRTPPKGVQTLGDLQRVLLLKAPKTTAPKKAPEAVPAPPKTEGVPPGQVKAEPKEPPAKASPAEPKADPKPPAAAGGKPKLQAPPPAGAGAVPPPITVPPPAVAVPDSSEDFTAPPTGVPTRPVSKVEQDAAQQTIVSSFPTQVAVDLLLLRPPLHPDEVSALISDYHSAQDIPIKNLDEFRDKAAKIYATDPSTVAAPKTTKGEDGEPVPLASLPPDEQATAIRKHQVQVVAMSLAARDAVAQNLSKKSGVPKDLAVRLSGFLLSGRDESPEDRQKRAVAEAESLFYEGLSKDPEPVSASSVRKILSSTKDPAAQRLAVGYLQAQDHQEARQRFLDPSSEEHISERQSPDVIASRLSKASEFLRERGARYPEGLSAQDSALTFRTRVLKHLSALAPAKIPQIQELLDTGDNAQYDKDLKRYEKATGAYQAKLLQADKDSDKAYSEYSKALLVGGDPDADPPLSSTERLLEAGLMEPIEPRKPPRYDLQRKTPEERGEAASGLWDDLMSRTASQRVAARYSASISTYPDACAMGQNRQAVYWGVNPYSKGQGPAPYVGWEQPQARDLGDKDFTQILKAARVWLKTPVLASDIDGVVRDTQLRAALDLAIDTEGYASVLHPTLYNNLLARLAGAPQDETLVTVTAFAKDEIEQSTTARMTTMPKDTVELKQAQADHFLARLDRMASTVQEKHEQWGMPLATAKEFVNGLDKLADEFEKAAYGEQSLTIRQASIILGTEKTAEVIQRDSDEKYMDTFANPQKPIQTEADEPYMAAYKSDDSSGVQNGSASNGRKLAP